MVLSVRRHLQRKWGALGRPVDLFRSQQAVRFVAHRPLDLQSLDAKWQTRWSEGGQSFIKKSLDGKRSKPKCYVLPMFPYPSGNLHMGHFRVYTISDVLSRFKRMQGHDVLHPMGWDAFGLPAENAAIERGVDPASWTNANIANMKTQLQAMNTHFDWDREIRTCDPSFYRHTQQLFLMLYERGLAYQAEAVVNYDPVDRTVLANEQVDANGFSWRSGAKVEKQMRKQWFLRITAFKEALLNDLDFLSKDDNWPAQIISMQRNWLGRSGGAKITFKLSQKHKAISTDTIQVFTTRPDTLSGVQYVALSTSHLIVAALASQQPELQAFIDSVHSLPADSKAGFLLPKFTALNPLSEVRDREFDFEPEVPIYVAPYVSDYGERAVMGVPGHDARDFAFWRANRGDSYIRYVNRGDNSMNGGFETIVDTIPAIKDKGLIRSTFDEYADLEAAEAAHLITMDLGKLAGSSETWRLRDWLISRQRYWGTPIPIVHCSKCGAQPVPEQQLPVTLPTTGRDAHNGNVAKHNDDWLRTQCPSCGAQATRETDTMDTFMDSSWYFMRFADQNNKHELISQKTADAYLPVDIYIGGVEHAILHLLYARFISKFLATTSIWPSGSGKGIRGEPFRQVISQGMVHGKTFTDPETGRFLKQEDLDLAIPHEPKIKPSGEIPNVSWEKMSKSKHNGVDPISCISRYGADIVRAHVLFLSPVSQVLEWDEERIVGIDRWFLRIWRYLPKPQEAAAFEISSLRNEQEEMPRPHRMRLSTDDWDVLQKKFDAKVKNQYVDFKEHELKAWTQVQKTIRSVTVSFSKSFALNTVISDLMELSNALIVPIRYRPSWNLEYQAWSAFFRMLAPIAPAFAEECWERLHGLSKSVATPKTSIFNECWPKEDGMLEVLENRGQTCSVQENGKFRFVIDIERPPEGLHEYADLQGLKRWALDQIQNTEPGKRFLEGREFEMMHIARKGKTVNFVTSKPPRQ